MNYARVLVTRVAHRNLEGYVRHIDIDVEILDGHDNVRLGEYVLVPVRPDTTQRRRVAGQDQDGAFNGEDYDERRFVTAWEVVE